MSAKKKIPFKDALLMIYNYSKKRVVEQFKSIAFIVLYLIGFQIFILRVPLSDAFVMAGGIAMVVFGLAFFLEGLILGLMPLGERVGVKLPTKTGIITIALFGILLGFGATLAEPAISSLRTAGSGVTGWNSPLLYLLLEKYTEELVLFIGIGVGVAVALGMFRFYYNFSIKPFILIIVPVTLLLTVIMALNTNLSSIIGLAWDSGAVTTGAVTVPLVLALGIGVSRAASKGKTVGGGFGIILLASLLPIISVMILGIFVNFKAPKATDEITFFSPANRQNALLLFGSEEKLLQHAFTHGTENGRIAFYENDKEYYKILQTLVSNQQMRNKILDGKSLNQWLIDKASELERDVLLKAQIQTVDEVEETASIATVLKNDFVGGIRAVIPLSVLLIIVLTLFLKERIKFKDEIITGIVFTLIGMTLLTTGIQFGLASLGNEVGTQLPRAFASNEKYIDRVIIQNFDTTLLFKTINTSGEQKTFFNLNDNNRITQVEFNNNKYDKNNNQYEHIITQAPLFKKNLTVLGIILVLLFAFGMGYGATLAEPALNALGMTVETITVGTMKRNQIVQVVSIGVGLGILLGLVRILFDFPFIWLLLPSYILLLILTIFSDKDFAAIAWDSGGVTTGPVTVPLVLAMGLGIGGALNIADGFGILTMASCFPIITVLIYGFYAQAKQKQSIQNTINPSNDE